MENGNDTKNNGFNNSPDLYTGEPPLVSARSTWSHVQKDLSYALGANIHRSWTARLNVTTANEREVVLSAETRFIASKVRSDYLDNVKRLWQKHDQVAPPRQIKLSGPIQKTNAPIMSAKTKTVPSNYVSPKTASQAPVQTPPEPIRPSAPRVRPIADASPLNTNASRPALRSGQLFRFDSFVVGRANQFAYSALQQVANSVAIGAGVQYNPVLLYGNNGTGKTHLLYALKNEIEDRDPMTRVNFLTSEQFVNDFVRSLTGKETGRGAIERFKAGLRNVDVLIIDDVQLIAGKPASHEELLQTLIVLVSSQTQIIIAMDQHPDEIDQASPRLKSYLRGGLVCKIELADYDLRIKMLDGFIQTREQSGASMPHFPRPVREFLAARVKGTPRDLQGEFNRIVARADMTQTAITIELVESSLADTRFNESLRLTMDRIQRTVCEEFGLTLPDMSSKRRSQSIARPRQIAMMLCKTLTHKSLPEIGRKFGGRDHTTVLHAVKRIKELRAKDEELDGRIKSLEAQLRPQHL